MFSCADIFTFAGMSSTEITVWHNNRCGKSREAIKRLEEKGIPFQVRSYMQEKPDTAELKSVLKKLGLKAADWVRKKESIYGELFGDRAPAEEELLQAMSEYPQLIERPVVIKGNKALIARPAELLDALL